MNLQLHTPVSALSAQQVGELAALARAWCRALELDGAAAALRPLATAGVTGSDPARLRRAAGLPEGARPGEVLEALARRTADPWLAVQLEKAASLAWEASLP